MNRKLVTGADPVMSRTRAMYATLKHRSGGRFLLTLAEFRDLFGQFYDRPVCAYCGKVVALKDVSVDHKIPVSKGGTSYADNLQFICTGDNKSKGDMTRDEYLTLLDKLDEVERYTRNFKLKSKILTALRISASFRFGADRRARRA
jgi:hypothetical protein